MTASESQIAREPRRATVARKLALDASEPWLLSAQSTMFADHESHLDRHAVDTTINAVFLLEVRHAIGGTQSNLVPSVVKLLRTSWGSNMSWDALTSLRDAL